MFTVRGAYRVQSRSEPQESELRGTWWRDGKIDSTQVNAWLAKHPLWRGQRVDVRSAAVSYRTGAFAEGDALYYRDHFTGAEPAYDLQCNIIDVTKLAGHWTRRAPVLRAVFDPASWSLIESRVDAVMGVASDEYHVHEAGHALGWSVQQKARAGYFRLVGMTAWPLVFVEELRADLGSFGAALDLLDPEAADALFLYHLAHRFGLVAESGDSSVGVPFLLFGLCLEHRALAVDEDGLIRITDSLGRAMRACAELGARELTGPDLARVDAADAAMNAAVFFRRYALDEQLARTYERVFGREALNRRTGRSVGSAREASRPL